MARLIELGRSDLLLDEDQAELTVLGDQRELDTAL
jgi:hypothetical protein